MRPGGELELTTISTGRMVSCSTDRPACSAPVTLLPTNAPLLPTQQHAIVLIIATIAQEVSDTPKKTKTKHTH